MPPVSTPSEEDDRAVSPRTNRAIRAGASVPLSDPEHWSTRLVFAAILVAIVAGFWFLTQQFWVPAHGGTDQNGYLVGGKNFADHLSTGFRPDDPYAFVGRMWVEAPDGRCFPKYPLGLPILVAAVWKVAGPTAVYSINPVAMGLALLAVFLIAQQVTGSFGALLATVMLAGSPVALGLANNPNSHATALAFACWGIYLLLRWWGAGGFARAALAGLLLGYAATIRYSEALLGLPLLAVACFNLRGQARRPWGEVVTLVACWLAPVLALLLTNRLSMGSWTGYDVTNESTGFRWEYFARNWELMLRQFAGTGLFLTLPIGLLGLILLFARSWRLALFFWLWFLPGVLLYTAYYWAPDSTGIVYMRFFVTLFPPVVVGAAWCLTRLAPAPPYATWAYRWVVAPVAALVLVLGAAAYNVWAALPMLAADQRRSQAVHEAAQKLIRDAKAPPGSVVFGPREMLHHLQFVGDFRLYATEEFDRRYVRTLAQVDPDEPSALQPQRAAAVYDLLKDKDDRQLALLVRELVAKGLNANRRVYFITPGDGPLPQALADPSLEHEGLALAAHAVLTWTEPPYVPDRRRQRALAGGTGAYGGDPPTSPPLPWQLIEVTRAPK